MAVVGLQPVRMFDSDEFAITSVVSLKHHLAIESRIDIVIGFGLDIRS